MGKTTYYTTDQVAEMYAVKRGTVNQWIYMGLLVPSGKFGSWQITEADLKAFEKRRQNRITRGQPRSHRDPSRIPYGNGAKRILQKSENGS